ncbi:YfiT family bacillithiol transferase [Paenibacillus hubeiensis]|uniref:YfiT family bacillithiol transferase n=1 Tax=Paenibacillus hubeiensis TaxID=3077330 RepID=UPI0031BA86B0
MDPIRYPIGHFQPQKNLSGEQLCNLIHQIPELIIKLKALLNGRKDYTLNTPYRMNGWTIKQIVHHIADNDMNAYLRFKRGLTEENPLATTYREDLWAELNDYKGLPIENSLALIELLHHRFFYLLIGLDQNDFKRTIQTEVLGTITLGIVVQRFIWHNKRRNSRTYPTPSDVVDTGMLSEIHTV